MDKSLREVIRREFQAGKSFTKIKEEDARLYGLSFFEFLRVLGLTNYEQYHAQYEKNRKRSSYYARSRSGFRTSRLKALERDGHRCIICHSPAKNVHHIDEFKDSQDSELSNLVTLCTLHHAAAHGRIGPFMTDRYGQGVSKARARSLLEEGMRDYCFVINRRTGRRLICRSKKEGYRELLVIDELRAVA